MVPRAGIEPARYHYHWFLRPTRLPIPPPRQKKEVASGFEPPYEVLQTSALPLGYAANKTGLAGFEPARDGVKVRCLTAWL